MITCPQSTPQETGINAIQDNSRNNISTYYKDENTLPQNFKMELLSYFDVSSLEKNAVNFLVLSYNTLCKLKQILIKIMVTILGEYNAQFVYIDFNIY